MGWHYPEISWSEFSKLLSDAASSSDSARIAQELLDNIGNEADVRDKTQDSLNSSAPSKSRIKYAELHCHSHFSFLDGASSPQALVEEAVMQGLEALAITDHNGFYGVVKFAEAAKAYGLPTIYGAELTLSLIHI